MDDGDGWLMDGDARYDSEDLLLGHRPADGTGTELDGVGCGQRRYGTVIESITYKGGQPQIQIDTI
jgi:hypothetical protein